MGLITESFTVEELRSIAWLMKAIAKANSEDRRSHDLDFVGTIAVWESNRERFVGHIKIDAESPTSVDFEPAMFNPEKDFNNDDN